MARTALDVGQVNIRVTLADRNTVIACTDLRFSYGNTGVTFNVDAVGVGAVGRSYDLHVPGLEVVAMQHRHMEHLAVQ